MSIFPFKLIPNDNRFDFMRLRWITLSIAAAMFVSMVALIAVKGFDYALDFTGGTVVELRFAKPADVEQVRERLAGAGFGSAQVQSFGSGSELLVRLQPREGANDAASNDEAARQVVAAATSADNLAEVLRSEFVGPQVGSELAMNGLYAAIFVVVGFLIYIGFRFEWKFAVVASLTTLFDVLAAAAWISLTGREFDLTVLAGLLAVMGFSINDTVVVFDRVRENFRSLRAEPLEI
ncbi:MAG TPA: protein translocase subunit SecF, partial [Pseudoxanthomonas sp.]|nr:protein translocase subunit SecF [Pseudoxanthomonas sp.]